MGASLWHSRVDGALQSLHWFKEGIVKQNSQCSKQ